MLVLSRKTAQVVTDQRLAQFVIPGIGTITILEAHGPNVRVGFELDPSFVILRGELSSDPPTARE